jgi:hypothetical protein
MYMCVFFLQRLGVLPPLRALCPDDVLRAPARDGGGEYEEARLLDPRLRSYWVRSDSLDWLIAEVEAAAGEVVEAKRRALDPGSANGRGHAHDAHARAAVAAKDLGLAQLLAGFLAFWELPFSAWAEGRLRCVCVRVRKRADRSSSGSSSGSSSNSGSNGSSSSGTTAAALGPLGAACRGSQQGMPRELVAALHVRATFWPA